MSAQPPASRCRPSWREPRFLVGVVLVAVSVAGVTAIVRASDRTVQVYAARHTLAAGDEIAARDLVRVRVRLAGAESAYLARAPRSATVVTRTVAAGELVPVAALAAAGAERQTSVVITVRGALSGSVAAGRSVDVWAAAAAQGSVASGARAGAPRVVVSGATVVRVLHDSGLGAAGAAAVEVRVPKDAAAGVLDALANGDQVSILPAVG